MTMDSDGLIVAIASEDGDLMPKGHFGEAPRFDFYRLNPGEASLLFSVDNPHAGEAPGEDERGRHHGQGGPRKGTGIGRVLGERGAQVMVSRAFGANIKRMRQRFLPVVVHCERVAEAIELLQGEWDRVREHWLQGEERKHLVLR